MTVARIAKFDATQIEAWGDMPYERAAFFLALEGQFRMCDAESIDKQIQEIKNRK